MTPDTNNIRNFCIIAHIDHGKSTLADRFLELTGTVEKRRMKAQYLDQLELERERGITIKMAPVKMKYSLSQSANGKAQEKNDLRLATGDLLSSEYILNLIDTPGHSDFSYEVSRALMAVEGAILLVDATQGIQAQTLANFHSARKAGLKIIGAVNKIDLSPGALNEVVKSTAELIGVPENEILKVSGKTGQGVEELLKAVIENVPAPKLLSVEARKNSFGQIEAKESSFGQHANYLSAEVRKILSGSKPPQPRGQGPSLHGEAATAERRGQASESQDERSGLREDEIFRALVFDSFYHEHKGVVAEVRVFGGQVFKEKQARLIATNTSFKIKEIGHFAPELKSDDKIENGQIGYIATGLKNPEVLKIGDTIVASEKPINDFEKYALPGYQEPQAVVFVSFYPEEADDYENLKNAAGKLKLNDSALKFEPDFNEFLGRGLKAGFLGRLHFEITAERLEKEFNIKTVHSFPSVSYKVKVRGGEWVVINNPKDFPADYLEVMEPIARVKIITPSAYLGAVINLQEVFRLNDLNTQSLGNSMLVTASLPLAELIRDFDDRLKSVSAGYASLSYEISDYKKTQVAKLEVLVAGHDVGGLTRIIHKEDLEREARKTVERLKDLLPRQQFSQAIQATSNSRVIARETIPAMKKLLGNFGKTGGDITRKMKLWKKQKRGKERLGERASKSKIDIPAKVFKELLKK